MIPSKRRVEARWSSLKLDTTNRHASKTGPLSFVLSTCMATPWQPSYGPTVLRSYGSKFHRCDSFCIQSTVSVQVGLQVSAVCSKWWPAERLKTETVKWFQPMNKSCPQTTWKRSKKCKKKNVNTPARNSALQFGLVQPVTLEISWVWNSLESLTAVKILRLMLSPLLHWLEATSDAGAWCYLSPLIGCLLSWLSCYSCSSSIRTRFNTPGWSSVSCLFKVCNWCPSTSWC